MKNLIQKILPDEPVFRWMIAAIVMAVLISWIFNTEEPVEQPVQKIPIEEILPAMSEEINVPEPVLSVKKENCEYDSLGEYQVIDIFSGAKTTPLKIDYRNYTNRFKIAGKIEDAFVCILSDVDTAYKGKGDYQFTTFVWFGNENTSGHVNVLSMPNNGMLYDRTSDPTSPTFDGKFFGNETPFGYYLNLTSIRVADRKNGRFKYIYPLQQLQREGEIRIGGFVNDSPHFGIGKILKFRIFYKGGSIQPVQIK